MTVAPGTPPAVSANVAGPLEVWVGTGSSGALQFLGYTINGADIEERVFTGEIRSDENGGDKGPPVDYQLFGVQHHIRLEFERFNDAVLETLEGFFNPSQTGIEVGSLLIGGSYSFRLLLCSHDLTAYVRNYPKCVILEPISMGPIGAQATRARLSIVSNTVAGTSPWNNTVS